MTCAHSASSGSAGTAASRQRMNAIPQPVFAVEGFIDDEVREAARCDHADPHVRIVRRHRAPQRPAEVVASRRRRLVRRIETIHEQRHDRDRTRARSSNAAVRT